jgi:hypothetical protein
MMEIGANTPAMIKAMTTEVESKNFIVASMHLCVESSLAGILPPSTVRSLPCPALPRADSFSHYTPGPMTGNDRHRGLAPATQKNERRQAQDFRFQVFTAAGEPPRRPAVFCTIVISSE